MLYECILVSASKKKCVKIIKLKLNKIFYNIYHLLEIVDWLRSIFNKVRDIVGE